MLFQGVSGRQHDKFHCAVAHGTSAKVEGALRLDQGCNKSKHVRRHVGDRRVSGLTQIKDGKLRALVRSRLSRYRMGQLGRSSRSCQNADGHCDLASARDRQNHRIVGYEGAPTHAWVRDGRKHARRICFSNPDGNRDTGKDHSRGRHQGLVAIGGKAGERCSVEFFSVCPIRDIGRSNRCQQELSARLQTTQAESGDPNIVWGAAGPPRRPPPQTKRTLWLRKQRRRKRRKRPERRSKPLARAAIPPEQFS